MPNPSPTAIQKVERYLNLNRIQMDRLSYRQLSDPSRMRHKRRVWSKKTAPEDLIYLATYKRNEGFLKHRAIAKRGLDPSRYRISYHPALEMRECSDGTFEYRLNRQLAQTIINTLEAHPA